MKKSIQEIKKKKSLIAYFVLPVTTRNNCSKMTNGIPTQKSTAAGFGRQQNNPRFTQEQYSGSLDCALDLDT